MSRIIQRELSTVKEYSERDIVLYLEQFLSKSLSGDSFSGSPWGNVENEKLYVAIFGIGDNRFKVSE